MDELPSRTVTSTEFQTRAGLYLDRAASGPVVITRHRRPSRVLLDVEHYRRLQKLAKERSTRYAVRAENPGEDVISALDAAHFGHL